MLLQLNWWCSAYKPSSHGVVHSVGISPPMDFLCGYTQVHTKEQFYRVDARPTESFNYLQPVISGL